MAVQERTTLACFFVFSKCASHGVDLYLGVRYSTSLLAISANRLAKRPLHQQNNGAPLRGAHQLFLLGGVLPCDLRYLPIRTSSNERLVRPKHVLSQARPERIGSIRVVRSARARSCMKVELADPASSVAFRWRRRL